jgi:DNA-binding HxlR family transcriptional regulator
VDHPDLRPDTSGAPPDCPVSHALNLLSGKWRALALFRLMEGEMRFNALARALAPVSPRVLAVTLRELEAEGLVWRCARQTVPPHVDYGLTPRGAALAPVFRALGDWAAK